MPQDPKPYKVVRASSKYTLASAAFDVVNYRNGLSANTGLPQNSTITSDIPNGVLGGSIAMLYAANNNPWESYAATYNSAPGLILGMYATSAGGRPVSNNQAAAGGVLTIYMDGGEFEVYYFETNTTQNGYGDLLASYTLGGLLYVSPFGLLSPVQPSALTNVYTTTPHNNVVGVCTKLPTATDLTLGVRMLPFSPTVAGLT